METPYNRKNAKRKMMAPKDLIPCQSWLCNACWLRDWRIYKRENYSFDEIYIHIVFIRKQNTVKGPIVPLVTNNKNSTRTNRTMFKRL